MLKRFILAALAVSALAYPALATVTGNQPPAVYTCTGTTTFAVPFPYLAATDLVVTETTSTSIATLTTPDGYTVKPSVAPTSGTLTLTTACLSGTTLTIARNAPLRQPQSFRTGSYQGAPHEQAFDRLEMQIQDIDRRFPSPVLPSALTNTTPVLAAGATTPLQLQAWFGLTANVLAFGAVGDGVADDTNAIRAAIATGKPVDFPAGIYKITGSIVATATGAWRGAGPGNVFDSNSGPGTTIIRCVGANGGTPFATPPAEIQNMHFDGVDKSGNGLVIGADDGTFVAFRKWRNVHVRNFNIGIHGYNWFNAAWDNLAVQGNHEGIRIDPTVTTPDGGYFTATDWRNIYIADNDVYGLYVSTPQGAKTWTITDIVIERNGANGTYQAFLQAASPAIRGLYVEGTSTKPGLQTNNVTLHVMEGFFNGTGGINATSNAFQAFFWHVVMATATDTITGLSALSKMVVSGNSTLQTDPRLSIGPRADVQWSTVAGSTITRERTDGFTTPAYGTTVAIDTKLGNIFQITPTDAVAFTVSNPTLSFGAQGQEITIQIRNTTAGAIGAATWSSGYKLGGAWTQPAAGFSRTIKFMNYGNSGTWTEVSRTTADVSN